LYLRRGGLGLGLTKGLARSTLSSFKVKTHSSMNEENAKTSIADELKEYIT
jgi:hypothetical protein